MTFKKFSPVRITSVKPNDNIFKTKIENCFKSTIPSSLKKCKDTGRIDALKLDLPVKVMLANPKVTSNNGRIALMRGPIVYACESIDTPDGVANMIIDCNAGFELTPATDLPEGAICIKGKALYEKSPENYALYFDKPLEKVSGCFTAIPYALWSNRGASNMTVWIRSI